MEQEKRLRKWMQHARLDSRYCSSKNFPEANMDDVIKDFLDLLTPTNNVKSTMNEAKMIRNFQCLSKLSFKKQTKIINEIKMMLHAHRDCLRNQKQDTLKIRFDCRDGYYGEAFGVLRGLHILGHGKFGAINDPETLNYLMAELEDEVLEEENFTSTHECDYCFNKYGKDDVRKK